jgi:hypothetical protein
LNYRKKKYERRSEWYGKRKIKINGDGKNQSMEFCKEEGSEGYF